LGESVNFVPPVYLSFWAEKYREANNLLRVGESALKLLLCGRRKNRQDSGRMFVIRL